MAPGTILVFVSVLVLAHKDTDQEWTATLLAIVFRKQVLPLTVLER